MHAVYYGFYCRPDLFRFYGSVILLTSACGVVFPWQEWLWVPPFMEGQDCANLLSQRQAREQEMADRLLSIPLFKCGRTANPPFLPFWFQQGLFVLSVNFVCVFLWLLPLTTWD